VALHAEAEGRRIGVGGMGPWHAVDGRWGCPGNAWRDRRRGGGSVGSKCTGVMEASAGRGGRGLARRGWLGEELARGMLLLWARHNRNNVIS
jgi:hypothetical protein